MVKLVKLNGAKTHAVSFLSENGRFLARVQGPVSGNVLLRREQYRRADDQIKSAEIARSIIIAKIANSRTVLLRAARENDDPGASGVLSNTAALLVRHLKNLENQAPLDTLRGIEGDAGRQYFSVFDHLITS